MKGLIRRRSPAPKPGNPEIAPRQGDEKHEIATLFEAPPDHFRVAPYARSWVALSARSVTNSGGPGKTVQFQVGISVQFGPEYAQTPPTNQTNRRLSETVHLNFRFC